MMSGAEHLALQELLPWYASGALGEAEAGRVQQHLRDCAACREDLAWQRKLLETEGPAPAGLDPERALARLLPRLEPLPSPANATPAGTAGMPAPVAAAVRSPAPGLGQRLRAWLGADGWRGWALGAQFAVIAVLASMLLWPRGEPAAYQALGRGAAATPDLLVVFKPAARLDEVQRLLQAHSAQIIGGPTVTGAYMLEVEHSRQARLLEALRADPAVELAESLTAGSAP
jgi:hypothetical protein